MKSSAALLSAVRSVKGRLPFRLGTTSYIIPDDILPNVRVLAPIVDDIELVLFESPDVSNLPSEAVVAELASIAARHSLSYTVHLPTDCRAGAADRRERERFIEGTQRILRRCAPLSPRAWVLHLDGVADGEPWAAVAVWQERCTEILRRLVTLIDDPARLAVENLAYPWAWHAPLVSRFGLSVCCDVGHLWVHYTHTWHEQVAAMLPAARVVHLHGVSGTSDHLSLVRGPGAALEQFQRMLVQGHFRGVVTLEVFNDRDFTESLDRMVVLWERLR